MSKIVLYIGNFSFPLDNAAGKRVYANGKLLRELGYEVIYIGISKTIDSKILLKETEEEYDGFVNYSLPYPKKSFEWANYKKPFRSIISLLESEKKISNLNMVIYYGSPSLSLFNTKLIRFCKRKKIKVISDCVDWLTVKTGNPVFDVIKWADNTYQKVYANKKADGLITISHYLEEYYKKDGKITIVIPPLSPIKYELYIGETKEKRKTIVYAGLPFRKGQQDIDLMFLKDRIDKTMILFHTAKKKGAFFVFKIYGFTKDEYLCSIPGHKKIVEELDSSVQFYGKQTNEIVIDSIRKADFTILIRDITRDTMAGFPTKVSESISCGTPVITTKTSDLEEYIIEGENGFFLKGNDDDIEILLEILSLKKENVSGKKEYCIKDNPFYFEKYVEKVDEYLTKLNMS